MVKRTLAFLLALLMLTPTTLMVSADNPYNDTDIDWSEHTTHLYDGCGDLSCNVCGYLRDTSHVDHVWTDATCTAPKTCSVCGVTDGEALGHVYTYPCDSSCDVCDATRDASHDWADATCTQPRVCNICGSEDGEALGHTWAEATCTAPKTCTTCGITEGEMLEHAYANKCDTACDVCGANRQVGNHIWAKGICAECGVASPSKVTITTQSKTSYFKMGAKISLKVVAKGDGLKYQWYYKDSGKTSYTKSTNKTATYSSTLTKTSKGRMLYCIVTDAYGNSVKSAVCSIREAASITTQPKTTYAKKGATVKVTVKASGDGLKYTWYFKNSGASKFTKSSITSATYSTTMSSTTKNRQVYCVVKDKWGKTVTTSKVTLREAVSITTQPKTVTVKKNATAKVTVKASGDGLTYTWYFKNAGKKTFSKSSIKTATYSTKMTATTKNRQVYCVVKDKWGKTVKTVTVTLKMK